MNYRHIYHAGNFADVFKHTILVLLLESLLGKEKPFCYVDTHAGLGVYDLQSLSARKTSEYLSGVKRILEVAEEIPQEVIPYVTVLKKFLPLYPGSPSIARSLLRPSDRMILMELHAEDVLVLKNLFAKDHQVAVHHYDGYQGLKAFLPPKERRGLVLIDPPFEQKNEFELVLAGLEVALTRFATGIYAIWYPIVDFTLVDNFLRALKRMEFHYLVSEMVIGKQTALQEFVGCGMVIVNPPWQIDRKLARILPWLWKVLSPNLEGGVDISK